MFLRKLLAYLFILSAYVSVRGIEHYKFSNISLGSGLSQITVICIFQDTQGYMWFGTRNGLNRYDGYKFDIFLTDPDDPATISDNHILDIAEDTQGYLWIGTNNGLSRRNPYDGTFQRYMADPKQAEALPNHIAQALLVDSGGTLWIGTNNGLCRYVPESDSFERITLLNDVLRNSPVYKILEHGGCLYLGTAHSGLIVFRPGNNTYDVYRHDPADAGSIAHDYVRSILIDSDENLWLGTHGGGVSVRRRGNTRFETLDKRNGLSNDYVRALAQSPQGYILAATFDGLNVIDSSSGELDRYVTYNPDQGELGHYSVYSLYFDRSGTLWVGTYAGGVDYYNQYAQRFEFNDLGQKSQGLLGMIGAMIETDDYIYMSSEGSGIVELDKKNMSIRNYMIHDTGPRSYSDNIVKSLYMDSGRLLCGTNTGTIWSFDLQTHRFRLFHDMGVNDPIYYLGRDSQGNLLAGGVNSQRGLISISREGEVSDCFPVGEEQHAFGNVRCVLELTPKRFLIGTRNDGLYDYDMAAGTLRRYKTRHLPGEENNIPDNYVTTIFRDVRNNIWIGTFSGGLSRFIPDEGVFEIFNSRTGFPIDNICAVVEDSFENLWISTISGISRFNPEVKSLVHYTHASGIQIDEFTPHSGLKLASERIMFGGNNGIITFDPHFMYDNPYIPPVVLRNLYLDNEPVIPGDQTGILSQLFDRQKSIVLKYDQSNISIEYSALNYIYPERNQYRYKLEGFDTEWNEVGPRRMAYYTNLPAGKYRFVVEGSNNDGLWNEQQTSVLITVLPPLWKTWWAYTIYFLVFIGALVFIWRYFSEKRRLQNDLKLEQAEAKAREEFHTERTRLFTNFSHELRTPLTLIMSPIQNLLDKGKQLSGEVRDNLTLMQNNADRLLRLVNNLMDFQKRESGNLQLRVSPGDFIGFASEMTRAFAELAASRDIELQFIHTEREITYWFDKRLIEKVFFNYLSNAFKNVPDKGKIEVRLSLLSLSELHRAAPGRDISFTDTVNKYILLEIADNGVGIPPEELEKIFIPFYQVAQNEHSASGTGLGLSLSKSIVEMHHGMIWAESQAGEGTVFRTVLPVNKKLYAEQDIADQYVKDEILLKPAALPHSTSGKNTLLTQTGDKKYSILVAEDNADVRKYIVSSLEETYNMFEAINGADALDKAFYHMPDLIISDVMMPRMDGMELVGRLKEDLRTGHIPIILITAKAMTEDIRDGYVAGADDYIVKPFHSSVVAARVENLILSREKLKVIYGKRFSLESLGVEVVSSDERFMTRLYEVMEKNVSNPEFNLDLFSKSIGMSRSQLYRKVKALTNLSPNEFTRNFRLEMAAKMLRDSGITISEVFVAVGFNSLAYFSNCFKSLYGMSPSDYVAKSAAGEI